MSDNIFNLDLPMLELIINKYDNSTSHYEKFIKSKNINIDNFIHFPKLNDKFNYEYIGFFDIKKKKWNWGWNQLVNNSKIKYNKIFKYTDLAVNFKKYIQNIRDKEKDDNINFILKSYTLSPFFIFDFDFNFDLFIALIFYFISSKYLFIYRYIENDKIYILFLYKDNENKIR